MKLLPVHLLFHDRFDPAPTLAGLRTPKLFIYSQPGAGDRYYERASDPKEKTTGPDSLHALKKLFRKIFPGLLEDQPTHDTLLSLPTTTIPDRSFLLFSWLNRFQSLGTLLCGLCWASS